MDRKMFEGVINNAYNEAHDMNNELDGIEKKLLKSKASPESVISSRERTAAEKEAIVEWENLYKEYFPEKTVDLSGVEIPKRSSNEEKELTKLIIRAEGITDEMLFQKCAELFSADKYIRNNLDEIIKDVVKRPKGAYAIWVRDGQEADKKHKNKSADMVEKEKLDTETLGERLAHELKYFSESGDHLDKKSVTICAGSRDSKGEVPYVHYGNGEMYVSSITPDIHGGFRSIGFRPRQVVSFPTKSEK